MKDWAISLALVIAAVVVLGVAGFTVGYLQEHMQYINSQPCK